jgi:hypothetical protein
MKYKILTFSVFLFISAAFFGCGSKVENSFTFKNLAAGDVYVNFRGQLIRVPAGQTSAVKEIPMGTYDYSTTYEVPSGVTSSSATGPLSGTVYFKAGTKILIVYSSVFEQSTYKIGATISNSDDSNPTTITGP